MSPPISPPPQPWRIALRETFVYALRTLSLVLSSSRRMVAALVGLTVLAATAPLLVAYAGKRIVDAVVARNQADVVRWVALELLFVVVLASAQRGLMLVRSLLGARLGADLNLKILQKAQGLELSFFENAEFYDKLTRARREASTRPVAMVVDSFGLVQNLITLTGYSILLTRFSGWVIPVLILATLPATLSEIRYSKIAFRLRNWRSPESRRLLYLEYVLANDEHAKEVKLFGIGPWLLERYRSLSETFYTEDRKLALRRSGSTHALSLLGSAAFYGTYALMATAAAQGRLSLGNLTLYIVSLRQGQQAFQSLLAGIGNVYEHNLYMSNLFQYFAIAEQQSPLPSPPALAAVPSEHPLRSSPEAGIRFEEVGFRYPGKAEWALRGLNLVVSPGESLALVGENGAGKTTLVKLLTRLYEPTEGRILLDGRDIAELPADTLRRRFGVVFQDFNHYQLRLRENVGFGSVDHLEDEPRIARAVERGGAQELVETLPGGLDAPLGHWFEKGSELSGGQWQKIALARAFMREEADILILDEPTAALDAASEHAVFERFRELSRGRTTLVISHRFPTVRMASRILVLEKGAIVEQGSHASLLALGGRYARMFKLQAEGYQ
ncbi:MAG TPA: ABC transporter ATP-binding protein [Polyangiaceae bacterium]|nr:ABC transporter ATP-binding protein [Polyangiaceae bacterium]